MATQVHGDDLVALGEVLGLRREEGPVAGPPMDENEGRRSRPALVIGQGDPVASDRRHGVTLLLPRAAAPSPRRLGEGHTISPLTGAQGLGERGRGYPALGP